ncbi:hypothetical protein V5O48_004275 [Marasmius crinis-equi]|uniref:ThrRS/AlaRS common domain-containing protein n=1 Tax=Marasmius crinis-equi TaxID=585013 RepID=A0ABR3FQK3_9AGAR
MSASAILLPPSTPQDYFQVRSPGLRVPEDPQVAIPVGILACQRDPLLRRIETTVVSCTAYQHPPPVKRTKNAVAAPSLPKDPILEVILHDTVIFPEGGGQPTDTGVITTIDGKEWTVLQAKRHGGHAVHYVHIKDGNMDQALSAFAAGSKVTAHLSDKDFDRRYDHMSMHTSQHLLSALLETRLNLPTLSWSLTSFPTPCYVELPRVVTVDEIQSIQNEANRLVFEGRRVHVEVEELDWASEKGVQILDNGRAAGKGLPQDYTGGVKRIIVIDGVDRNPCGAPLVPERVTQIAEERKRAEKRVSDLELELAKAISDKMVSEAKETLRDSAGTPFKKYIQRIDDGGSSLSFLSAIAFAFSSAMTESSLGKYLIVLSSSPSSQTATSTTLVMVFGSDDALVKAAGDRLKDRLTVKGGGKGPRWSGKYTGVWKDAKQGNAVEELLKDL